MWHTLYVNVLFFLKYNHAVDEVDIDEGCQTYVDESKIIQGSSDDINLYDRQTVNLIPVLTSPTNNICGFEL
jgi:hypothetical protein